MPSINKRTAEPPKLQELQLAAMKVGGDGHEKNAVLIGADGKLQTGRPTHKLPGTWTRFQAAFVGVPLFGRLESVKQAARLVRAVEFRSLFRATYEQHFGSQITQSVMPLPIPKGKKVTLSPMKIIRVVNEGNRATETMGRQNTALIRVAVGEESLSENQVAVARYARVLGVSQHADFFKKSLELGEPDSLARTAESSLERLRNVTDKPGAGPLPPLLEKVLASYEKQLEYAPVGERQQIARRCVDALDNLATIVESHEVDESSSDRSHAQIPASDVQIVSQLCAHAAGPEIRRYTPEIARQAWAALRDTRDRLRVEVRPSEQLLSDLLREVTSGRDSSSPAELQQSARKQFLVNEMKRLFEAHDPESTLWDAISQAVADHKATYDAPMTAVMGMLAKEMALDLQFRAGVLHQHLGCEDHLPTVIEKTRAKLIENTVAAAVGHLDALQEIEASNELTPAQKEVFRRYAQGTETEPPHRLDPVQVKHLTAIANTMAKNVASVQDPAVLFDAMVENQATFRKGLGEILQHAETMWISRSFDGTDSEEQLTRICVLLARAKLGLPMPNDKEPAGPKPPPSGSGASGAEDDKFFTDGAGPETQKLFGEVGGPKAGKLLTEEGRAEANLAMRQFMYACNQSPSMGVAKLALMFGDILRVSGTPIEENDPDSLRLTLNRVPPELLVRTLADPSGAADEGGSLDRRGVLADSLGAAIVARNFDPHAVLDPARHETKLDRARNDGGDSLPAAMNPALAGADVLVQGQRLTHDPVQGNEPAIAAFGNFLDTVSPQVGAAVSACISSNALRDFVGDVNAAAFQPPVVMTNPRGTHEIWQDPDGSWRVRSTHVSSPLAQAGKPINTDGIVLYTLTHTVTPTEDGGEPGIELSHSNVVFAF